MFSTKVTVFFLNIFDPWLAESADVEPAGMEDQQYFAQWLEVLSLFHHPQDKVLHCRSDSPGTCSQPPSCLSLQSAGIKRLSHHTLLFIIFDMLYD